ncbi:GPI12 [Candida margitis]|uniref:GPI12 n=1 Tax=Candida margitis TaxID=1775924 RepID=UPI002227F622|nr:GPI12 [Candida margitis]KAI5950414.1 GPI12 [Candida margitis]
MWILLTTSIPQVLINYTNTEVKTNRFVTNQYPQNSITFPKSMSSITGTTIYYIIGHPDDEVMFFSPTILELSKPRYNNTVKLLCFSKGDSVDESMGPIRVKELYKSASILGIDSSDVTVLDYKDGMNESWSIKDINESLKQYIDVKSKNKQIVLVTFDEWGVSNHPNHIALYHGANLFRKNTIKSNIRMYKLKSLGFWEKYSFTFLTNIELFVDYISTLIQRFVPVNITVSFFEPKNSSTSIKIYSDLNMLACSYAAMGYGHYSQMVWFRYGWLILSRYLTYNHLIEVVN